MYNNFFNDFDRINDLMLGFGSPTNIRFNTPKTKDVLPSYWEKWHELGENGEEVEVGFKCVSRTVGISPEDLSVTIEDYGICIDGKTTYEDDEYTQHIELPISEDVIANITEITYKSVNGLTYIYLRMKKPEKAKVLISRIE